ncbi:MAG: flagellar hook assembly protein FlgD [Acidimicrobiia bacterium]
MAITPIPGATATGAAPAATATTRAGALDQEAFLKLLVAQLKYQNPLSPTEGTEFVAQAAQFSMVERLEELARTAARAQATSQSVAAVSLVGRPVAYLDAYGQEATGVVGGARLTVDGPVLRVGDVDVALADVVEVGAPAAP